MFIIYFRHLLGTIVFLSVIVSASIDYSDFTLTDDQLEPVLTSLPIDQTGISINELSPPLDQTIPFFDEEFSSSTPDPLTVFDLPVDPENTPLDFSLKDSFELASCSKSEVFFPPALGKSRVRRADDSSSCANFEYQLVLRSILKGKYSITCMLVTAGVLPFAMAQSDSPKDVVINTNVLNSINTLNFGPRLYYPATLYRAILRNKNPPPSRRFAIQFNADLTF